MSTDRLSASLKRMFYNEVSEREFLASNLNYCRIPESKRMQFTMAHNSI